MIWIKYFWAIAIVVTCLNAATFKKQSIVHIKKNPDLAEGYARLLKGYLVWMNIPWVVMGIGCTIGGVPSVRDFFSPKDGNPFVLAWFGSVFLLWVLGTFWLFMKNGAKELAKHPGVLGCDISSLGAIKLLWCACLFGGIMGVIFMWTMDIQIQK